MSKKQVEVLVERVNKSLDAKVGTDFAYGGVMLRSQSGETELSGRLKYAEMARALHMMAQVLEREKEC